MSNIIAGYLQTQDQVKRAIESLVVEGDFAPDQISSFFVNPAGQHDSYELGGDRDKSLGSFLTSPMISHPETFAVNGKQYEIALRSTRYYQPFRLTLLKATHEKYKGTEIPKNFASRVRIENPSANESRETEIKMNDPLRYSGLTFFQYQMGADEAAMRAGQKPSSTFQVVRNPSWLTPYLSCVLISVGLIFQFMQHLVGFVRKRTS